MFGLFTGIIICLIIAKIKESSETSGKEMKGWIKVTNIKGTLKNGEVRRGFGIDGYLKQNLDGVPSFLKLHPYASHARL